MQQEQILKLKLLIRFKRAYRRSLQHTVDSGMVDKDEIDAFVDRKIKEYAGLSIPNLYFMVTAFEGH